MKKKLEDICKNEYDVFFHGDDLDERTQTVINKINISPKHKISFLKEKYSFLIDNDSYSLKILSSFFQGKEYKKILIDSTSLDFPEILYILNALNDSEKKSIIHIIYVEPKEYSNIIDDDQEEDFQLMTRCIPFLHFLYLLLICHLILLLKLY